MDLGAGAQHTLGQLDYCDPRCSDLWIVTPTRNAAHIDEVGQQGTGSGIQYFGGRRGAHQHHQYPRKHQGFGKKLNSRSQSTL